MFLGAEGVVEEGGELVGLPRYGLGGGFLALDYESADQPLVSVPRELVPAVRELIAKHRK